MGVVTTLQPDGSPQSTVVWVDVDDDGPSINTAYGRVKPRNLARDPRISLVVVDPNDPYRWVKLNGTGTLVDEGADEHIDRLSLKYTGNPVTRTTRRTSSASRSGSRRTGSRAAGWTEQRPPTPPEPSARAGASTLP